MTKFFKIILILLGFSSIQYSQEKANITHFLKGIKVEDICSDGVNIWVATNGNGVYQYSVKNNKWTSFSTNRRNLPNDFVYSIAANTKYVWAGSIDGLMIFNKKSKRWSKRKFSKGGQLSNWIRSIAYDSSAGLVWIGRFKYLTKYNIKKRRFTDYDLTTKGNEKTNTIKVIKVDGDSLVWFGTEGGLHKYDKFKDIDEPGAVTFYDNRLNYFNGEGKEISISAILFEQNNIWIGLDEFITPQSPDYNLGGLFKFDRKNDWERFDSKSGLSGNGIFDLARTGNFIWASLYQFGKDTKEQYGRGVALINLATEKVSMIFNDKIPAMVPALYFDGDNMWMGTDSGILRLKLTNTLAHWLK